MSAAEKKMGPYRTNRLHFIPETWFTLDVLGTQWVNQQTKEKFLKEAKLAKFSKSKEYLVLPMQYLIEIQ
jgi:hypothetical protein